MTLPGFAFAYAMSSCAPAKSRDLFFTFRRWRPRGRTIEQVFVDSGLAGKRDALTRTLYYGEQRQLELALALPARMRAKPAGPCAIMWLRRSIWRMGDLPKAVTGLPTSKRGACRLENSFRRMRLFIGSPLWPSPACFLIFQNFFLFFKISSSKCEASAWRNPHDVFGKAGDFASYPIAHSRGGW